MFILKLQDMLTPGMKQAAGISESSASKIKSQFTGIEYSGKKMGASINDLKYRLESINKIRVGTHIKQEFKDATTAAKVLERQIEKLENKGRGKGSSGGFSIGKMVAGNLISGGISQLVGLAKSGLGSIVSASVAEEQAKVGLKTFLGAKGADDAYKNIKQDAAVTPFDTASLLASNRALISAGASAKDARQDTLNLANAVAAVGGGNDVLSRMSANMQQIKTVGKATAMDVRQFGMAGINIYQMLADVTGKNIDQVKEMDVSYSLLSKALQHAGQQGGMYFGAMEAQSKTIGGKWSTFMDNLTNSAADLGTSLQPIFHFLLDMGISITDNFSKILPYIQPVIDIINTLPGIIGNLTSGTSEWSVYFDVVRSFALSLWATIKSIFGNIMHIVGGVADWMGKSELMKDIFWGIGKAGEFILGMIRKIGDMISWVWDHVIKPIMDKIDWAYEKIKSLTTWDMKSFGITMPQDGDGKKLANYFGGAMNFNNNRPALLPGLMPGANVTNPSILNQPKNTNADGGKINTDLGKQKSESINQGGQRSIVITIGKQIEKLEVHVMDAKEGVDEIEGMVKAAMKRLMYSMNGVAG